MKRTLLTGLFALVLSAGAASAHGIVVRFGPPPPPPRQVVVMRPAPGYVWTPGYYYPDGGRYAWKPGRWVAPPHRRAMWVPGYWAPRHGGYVWIEGYWRRR